MIIRRYLASIASVFCVIPGSALLAFTGMLIAFGAFAIGPVASLFSITLSFYTIWRQVRRQRALHSWRPYKP